VRAAPPDCPRRHVYVFAINGLTILPHIYGSMNGVGEHIEGLGLPRPRVASHYWRWAFQNEVRRIRAEDPCARFVLIGYSIGGGVTHSMCRALEADGVEIALLVYVDAHTFVNDFHRRPANVCRVVNVISSALCLPGKVLPEADANYRVEGVWHLGVPKHEATLEVLAQELDRVAATVPPCPGEPGH
jgi:hypothetical protein